MVGHFSTPITPESGSFLHADSHLTEASALRLLAALAERLGVELDVEAELEAAREEAAGRAEADRFPAPPDDGGG